MNLLDLFDIRRRERPESVALAGEGGEEWTYGDLLATAEALAAGWAEGGLLRAGERAAFLAGNSPELVVAQLAALRLGAIVVPINPTYRAREVAHVLADAEPRLVVTGGESAGVLEEVVPGARRSVERVARLEELDLRERGAAGAGGRLPRGPDGSDPALLVYTSGTTGKSKGAVLTHDNLLATVTGLLAAWAWRPEDVLLLTLPLFHVHGLVVGLWTALAAGARVELRRRFDAVAAAEDLAGGPNGGQAGRTIPGGEPGPPSPTVFFGVPTMYVRLVTELRRRAGAGHDISGLARLRLFASGSAPLAPETFYAFRDLTGHAILERYGMSEAGM
ncbi:MAG TPA: AMP-binding protein, partial [Thermoanaerobaculia bacterium]|nr:AMP-binding protein [Thermoanaerobaculia bacterium]